jgi:hypothetical protein
MSKKQSAAKKSTSRTSSKKKDKKTQALVPVKPRIKPRIKPPVKPGVWQSGDEKLLYSKIIKGDLKDAKSANILRRLYETSDQIKIKDDMVALRYFIAKFLAGDSDIDDPAAAAFAFIQAHRALASYWNMAYRFEKSIDQDKLNEIRFSLKLMTEVSGVFSMDDLDDGEMPDEASVITPK